MVNQNLLFFDKQGEQYNFEWNGNYWEGSVLFPLVSEKLFEIEHIFIIEKFLNNLSETKYGFPHSYGVSPGSPVWRTKWESAYDGKIDVSSIIYTYELGVDGDLDAPVLVKSDNVEFFPEVVPGDAIDSPSGIVITAEITSSSMQINIALNSDNEGVYDRVLVLEDYTDPANPVTILRVSFHGEVEGEDSRLGVLLDNFGRSFIAEDSFIVRETDIKEPLPDFSIINQKRKELLLTGESIFPYLGSYKSLFNAIKFFGYYDLRIKEYWLNIKKDSATVLTSLQQNSKILKELSKKNLQGQDSLELISSLLKDENQGKFKQVEIYGKKSDGSFGLKKQFEQIFPSKSYKKTSLFGLFYDINRVNESVDEDEFGYPVVEDVFLFSPEEVLIKLFGLKERLKRDYLPLNARIVDITGEGVYFNIYKTRGWVDQLGITEIKSGIKVDFTVFPEKGYVEDLRVFYTKPNQESLLYPAINGTEPGISYYGNTVDPYSFFQEYPLNSIVPFKTAIESFYQDVDNGAMPKFLGDGDYDYPGYQLFSTGTEHVFPAGCPVIIKDSTFGLAWDEISACWETLNPTITTDQFTIASYTGTVSDNPGTPFQTVTSATSFTLSNTFPQTIFINIGSGNDWFESATDNVFVRVESDTSPGNLCLGYVIPGGYNTGTGMITIQVISTRGSGSYSVWNVSPTNISFSSYNYTYFQNYVNSGGFYSWSRLPYLDFYEIEWTIYKQDDRPYYFQIRGGLPELETIVHFLPYSGDYNVKCRVWDTLNSISLGIKRSVITVSKREIELNTITRFRQSEKYDWENMPLKWESYPSQWIWPVENTDETTLISDFIQNFPEYSNNFNEGQSCEVLSKIPEVKATTTFELNVASKAVSTIQSSLVGGGYDLAVVTTSLPHGFLTGDTVWILDSSGDPYGQYEIVVLSTTTFQIPEIVITPISGGSVYGPGNIKIFADSKKIADCNFQGDIEATCSLIYSTINNSALEPKYKIISLTDSVITIGDKTFVIQAPNDSGSLWNGKTLTIQVSGSISATPASTSFSGGSNQTEEYVEYDFGTLPKAEMKYWGTKKLCWDTFEDFEFAKAYANTWDMYDYHNDWLGGFDLYSLQYGDRIKITQETNGIVLTESDSPGNSYLDLFEAANQFNSSGDENISRFDYVVRGYSELPEDPEGNLISPDITTTPGPRNISSNFWAIPSFSPVIFEPTGIAWDGDGDIWVTGEDLVRFDGANFETYNSTNSPIPGIAVQTNCIKIDRNDVKWIGVESTDKPLVKINDNDPEDNFAFDVTDFVDNQGNMVCPDANSSIKVIEINPQSGDIFAAFISDTSPSYNGLLFYDGFGKSWNLFTPSNSDLGDDIIRDLKLEYYSFTKWYLWIATENSGLIRFDGVNFRTFDTSSSGVPSNDVYSIELDSLNHKWIGTDNGLAYWDEERWAVWNNSTNPEISAGNVTNVVETGNGNIWFTIEVSASVNELYFFDGYFFTKVLYRNDGSTLIDPCPNFYGKSALSAPWKTFKNGETTFPRNLIFTTLAGEIGKLDYIIPHIHATSKFSGTNGWDFVYHETSTPLPKIKYIYNSAIGNNQIGFNFLVGPFYDNITLNSDVVRPEIPSVDRYSWYKPTWQRYSLDNLKNQFPSLNLNDTFLYAPLRDIIRGRATKESYWRNAQIERILQKKSNDLFQNFEWVVTLGSNFNDQGVKLTVDSEGFVIGIGDFRGTITMGEKSNISTVTLTESTQSVYVTKYNKVGVLQWAISLNSPGNIITSRSVTTDAYNNLYVVYEDQLSSNLKLVKISPDGVQLNSLTISVPSTRSIFDVKTDKYENVYICGSFRGTVNFGPFTLTATNSNGFIAKLDFNFDYVWVKQIESTSLSRVFEIAVLNEEYVYCSGIFSGIIDLGGIELTNVGSTDMFLAKFDAGSGTCLWAESLAATPTTSISTNSITLDPNGHLLVTGAFTGTLELEGQSISSFSSSSDIFVMKLLSTGKLLWMKMCGGDSGDFAFDIESDSQENVYITGSFTTTAYFSPESVVSRGGSDIYLTKFNKDGLLIDIVTAGGVNSDSGADLVLDNEENIYVTGLFRGNADFSPYIATPPGTLNDAFIGKIPKERFHPGLSIGSVQSWLGSHSWSWREERFYQEEFEIPLASTIFINPIDSLIPGKKNHTWVLTDTETGEEIVRIRRTPYFIWTFTSPGFYSISCQLQDANGNTYETQHKGKVRVIDHKEPFAGDLIPDVVNPEDYLIRTIYDNRKTLGFPPLSKFDLEQESQELEL
jgi:hypothetical protein